MDGIPPGQVKHETDSGPFIYEKIHLCHERIQLQVHTELLSIIHLMCLYVRQNPIRSHEDYTCFYQKTPNTRSMCRIRDSICKLTSQELNNPKLRMCVPETELEFSYERDAKHRLCSFDEKPPPDHVTCKHDGDCYIVNTRTFQKLCTYKDCPAGYDKKLCEKEANWTSCSFDPCGPDVWCIVTGRHSYKCTCLREGQDPQRECKECKYPRWGRQDCSNECGACNVLTIGEIYCHPLTGCSSCMEGVSQPPECNKVDCKTAICRHNGRCKDHKCSCSPLYTGTLCEERMERIPDLESCPEEKNKSCNQALGGLCVMVKGKQATCICPDHLVGSKCQYACKDLSETCQHGLCVADICTCFQGYEGKQCQFACEDGTYGDCKTRCGHCIIFPCNHIDGHCKQAEDGRYCDGDYQPPLCKRELGASDPNTASFAGSFRVSSTFTEEFLSPTNRRHQVLRTLCCVFINRLFTTRRANNDRGPIAEIDEIRFTPATGGLNLKRRKRKAVLESPVEVGVPQRRLTSVGNRTSADESTRVRRQSSDSAGIRVEFVFSIPISQVSGPNYEAEILADMKNNAKQFDPNGEYQIDINSIQINEETGLVSSSPEAGKTLIYTAVGAVCALLILFMASVLIWRTRKNNFNLNNAKKKRPTSRPATPRELQEHARTS